MKFIYNDALVQDVKARGGSWFECLMTRLFAIQWSNCEEGYPYWPLRMK